MRVLITGTSKLSGALIEYINALDFITHIDSGRDKELMNINFDWSRYDIFLNCAHIGFKQTELLFHAYQQWHKDPNKLIVNFSSRAHKPNISKGLLYSAQKAALNHMCDNIVYNTDCECGVVVLNLGLLEDELPSTSYKEVCERVERTIDHFIERGSIETEITLQNKYNYRKLQKRKEGRYQ